MTKQRWVPFLLLPLWCVSACQERSPAGSGEPPDPHSHDKVHAVLWMHEAAEYAAACQQTFAVATRALESAVADPTIAALPNVAGAAAKVAVITDLDETLLDNIPFQVHQARDGVEFGSGGWTAWVQSGRVKLLPGAAAFLRRAAELHVDVFYVSNRTDPDHTAATIAALRDADPSLANELHRLLLKPKGGSSDKEARRQRVAKDHRVALLLGDDLGDFRSVPGVDPQHPVSAVLDERRRIVDDAAVAARWGCTWILLPNPSYGSWARVYEGADAAASHRLRVERLRSNDPWTPPR